MKTGIGYTLRRKRVSSNFVPSLYHSSKELQQYNTIEYFPINYNEKQWMITNVVESINTFKDNFFVASEAIDVRTYTFYNSQYL